MGKKTRKHGDVLTGPVEVAREVAYKAGIKNIDHFLTLSTGGGCVSKRQRKIITAAHRLRKGNTHSVMGVKKNACAWKNREVQLTLDRQRMDSYGIETVFSAA